MGSNPLWIAHFKFNLLYVHAELQEHLSLPTSYDSLASNMHMINIYVHHFTHNSIYTNVNESQAV